MENKRITEDDLPQIITNTFKDIESIEKKIEESESQAKTARDSANTAHEKSAGWSFMGANKKEAIEALQTAAIEQSEALLVSIEASKKLFEYQGKLADSIRYLFGLGVTNLAANRTVVRELEIKLRDASKEKLSELAKREIHNVIQQLRAQEDMFNRINGHDSLLREHKTAIDLTTLSVKQLEDDMNKSLGQLSTKIDILGESLYTRIKELQVIQQQEITKFESDYLAGFSSLKTEISNKIQNIEIQVVNLKEETFNSVKAIDERADELSNIVYTMQHQMNKKCFLDSIFYKVFVGVSAIVALVLYLISTFL